MILLQHIILIVQGQGIEHLKVILFQLQTLIQVAYIGNIHITGAAAALDIVDLTFAEYGNLGAFRQGQKVIVVLQQHGTFGSGSPGKLNVVVAGCDAGMIIAQYESIHLKALIRIKLVTPVTVWWNISDVLTVLNIAFPPGNLILAIA